MDEEVSVGETTAGAAGVSVLAPPEVRALIARLGGTLYVWKSVHGCCTGKVALLETGAGPPPVGLRFRRIDAGGFGVEMDVRALASLHTLELEAGRRGSVKAFWNGQGWVG